MEKIFANAEEMVSMVKEYINTRIESVKLSVAEKTSSLTANLVAGGFLAVVLFFFLLFSGVALSLALGAWLHAMWAGFLITAFLYLLLGIIFWAGRTKWIRLPVMNAIISSLFTREKEEQKDHE